MQNTKLYNLLNSFSKDELKEFTKFINSPFHNSNKKIIEVFSFLKKYLNTPGSNIPELKVIYLKIYPGKVYNSFIIRNLLSNMVKLIEEFIAVSNFKNDPKLKEKKLLESFRTSSHNILYEKRIEDIMKKLGKNKIKDEKYFLEMHDILFERRTFEEQKIQPGKRQQIYDSINDEANFLILFFVTLMLKKYFSILNYKRSINFSHNIHLYQDIMKILDTNRNLHKENLLLEVLYSFLKLYETNNDNKLYFKLKSLVLKNRKLIPPDDYKDFGIELYNYAKSRRASNDAEFKTETYELLKQLVKEDVFLEEKYMTAHSYINIAASAFFEKDFQWAESFIEDYKNKVFPKQRDNAYNYNLSVLNYLRANESTDISVKNKLYNKSIDIISKVKSEDFYYMVRIKKHLIKIYYVLEEFENLDNTLLTFKQYLNQNDKMSNEFKEMNFTFISYINKLKNLRQNPIKSKATILIKEIESKEKMELKTWFIDRIKELGKESR